MPMNVYPAHGNPDGTGNVLWFKMRGDKLYAPTGPATSRGTPCADWTAMVSNDGDPTRVRLDGYELGDDLASIPVARSVWKDFEDEEAAEKWRAAIRQACRAKRVKVRTSISKPSGDPNDGRLRIVVNIWDADRVVTDAEKWRIVNALPVPPGHRTNQVESRRRRGSRSRYTLDLPVKAFMEITRREDIGADLNVALEARGGVASASYRLVPLVRPGDVVIHYDSRNEAIVGVSVATGHPESTSVFWVSRGSYARRAGEQARWLRGIRVPLGQYRQLEHPLTLTRIRAEKDALLAIRAQLQTRARGKPMSARRSLARAPGASIHSNTCSGCIRRTGGPGLPRWVIKFLRAAGLSPGVW